MLVDRVACCYPQPDLDPRRKLESCTSIWRIRRYRSTLIDCALGFYWSSYTSVGLTSFQASYAKVPLVSLHVRVGLFSSPSGFILAKFRISFRSEKSQHSFSIHELPWPISETYGDDLRMINGAETDGRGPNTSCRSPHYSPAWSKEISSPASIRSRSLQSSCTSSTP